jgi:glycosyltransferase involved in cell wall biosynthesis
MSSPLVTVLVPTHNNEETIGKTLLGLLKQSYTPVEILVLDSNSTDDTVRVAERIGGEHVVVLDCENRNLSEALNYGARCAGGMYLARQGADDWSAPQRFESQVEYLEANPEVGVVGTGGTLHTPNGASEQRRGEATPTVESLQDGDTLIHGSLMIRANVFTEVDGYDERFAVGEDYDLLLRLAELCELRNLDDCLYEYTLSAEGTYGGRMAEVKLYHMLARRRSLTGVTEDVLDRVETDGIDWFYEELSEQEQFEYHTEMAQESLQFGRQRDARHYAAAALKLDIAAYPLLLYGFGLSGRHLSQLAIRWYQKFLNTRRDSSETQQ